VGLGLGSSAIPTRLLFAGIAVSILPDLDVLAFQLHIPYANEFGHRGASHSLFFACMVALLGALMVNYFHVSRTRIVAFLLLVAASHGILDSLTNGGMGIAFFWPFTSARYVAPIHVIEVSPLSMSRIMSSRISDVLISEVLWIWLPCLILMMTLRYLSKTSSAQTLDK